MWIGKIFIPLRFVQSTKGLLNYLRGTENMKKLRVLSILVMLVAAMALCACTSPNSAEQNASENEVQTEQVTEGATEATDDAEARCDRTCIKQGDTCSKAHECGQADNK